MSVNNINNSQSIFDQINQQNGVTSTSETEETDSDMFMKLMIAQLQNQDPSNPSDTGEFMQQIATMSNVESINQLNVTMESMASSMLASQAALQASSMVGQSVYTRSDEVVLNDSKQIRGVAELPTSASDVRVSVYDRSGEKIQSFNLGAQAAGDLEFSVDLTGQEEGAYRVVVQPVVDGEYTTADTYLAHNVNSVTLGQNGIGMKVNTDVGAYTLDDVKQIG